MFQLRSIVESRRKTATLESMRVIRNALEQYRDDVDQYPTSLRDLIKRPVMKKLQWNGTIY